MAALDFSKGRDVQYAAGLALALSGNASRSETLAGDLEKRFSRKILLVKFTYAPVFMRWPTAAGKAANAVGRLEIRS